MIDLPLEIIYLIAKQLNFRSLSRLRLTCTTYNQLLEKLFNNMKQELFAKYTFTNEQKTMLFIPGPAIKNLHR